jgi:hypothetical protein
LYRFKESQLEVFLVHPGGPFWSKKDEGTWSISKGEYEEGEDPWVSDRLRLCHLFSAFLFTSSKVFHCYQIGYLLAGRIFDRYLLPWIDNQKISRPAGNTYTLPLGEWPYVMATENFFLFSFVSKFFFKNMSDAYNLNKTPNADRLFL